MYKKIILIIQYAGVLLHREEFSSRNSFEKIEIGTGKLGSHLESAS